MIATPHVAISAIIGAGKTSLATKLAEALGTPVYYEPVSDNAMLKDFYDDMERNAFTYQIYLLNRRFEQQQLVTWYGAGGVQDRSIYEDTVFAKMLCEMGMMRRQDLDVYLSLFKNMSRLMAVPDLVIHLDVTPKESLRRVRLRGRECEKGITLEYLEKLSLCYEEFLGELSQSVRVIRIDWNGDPDVNKVVECVTKEFENMRHVKKVRL